MNLEQYEKAIRYTAQRPYTPVEVVDLIAELWAVPRAGIEEDIRKARNPAPLFVTPEEAPHA